MVEIDLLKITDLTFSTYFNEGLDNEKLKVLQVLVLLGSSIHNPREAFLLTLPERGMV